MNMINLLIAKAAGSTGGIDNLVLAKGCYHVFDSQGEYKDFLNLNNTHQAYVSSLGNKLKRCIIVRGYGHKDEWRLEWHYINNSGRVTSGTEFDCCGPSWHRLIDPKSRKPWYWDRKLTALKSEYPKWQTDIQEGVNIRAECREILNELETNFNINNNYYRMQANAAEEAHSIICGVDMMVQAFEQEMARTDYILEQREMTGWTDERDDLQL